MFGFWGSKEKEAKQERVEGSDENKDTSVFSSWSTFTSAVKTKVEKSTEKVSKAIKTASEELRHKAIETLEVEKEFLRKGVDAKVEEERTRPVWYYPADAEVEEELKTRALSVTEIVDGIDTKTLDKDAPEYHYFMKVFGRDIFNGAERVLTDPLIIDFAKAASEHDPRLGRVRYFMVPRHVSEGQFWRSFQLFVEDQKEAIVSQGLNAAKVVMHKPTLPAATTSEKKDSVKELPHNENENARLKETEAMQQSFPTEPVATVGTPKAASPIQVEEAKESIEQFEDEEDFFVSEEASNYLEKHEAFEENRSEEKGEDLDDDDWEEELKRELEELKNA